MANNNLQELVGKAYEAHMEHGRAGSGLPKAKENVDEQVLELSIQLALIALGLGFACLAIALGDSWVKNSPLLNVIGAVVCLLFLILCWITGGLLWLITSSKAVCIWAGKLLPYCIQPYRSASAIVTIFIVVALFFPQLLHGCNQLLWFRKHRQPILALLHRLLRLLAIVVVLATTWLKMWSPEKTPRAPQQLERCQYDSVKAGSTDVAIMTQ
jgi:hypothetical protein